MELPDTDIIDQFSNILRELKGEPHVVENEIETIQVLQRIVSENNIKKAVAAGFPEEFRSLIKKGFSDLNLAFVDELRNGEVISACESADVGVTWANFGVAKLGALIEVVYDDAAKLASSLPFTHVALVSSKRILNDLTQAMAEVEKILHSSSAGRMPAISFISGPSKTSDIELKLLYGVHGPNALHVLILKWV